MLRPDAVVLCLVHAFEISISTSMRNLNKKGEEI